LNWPRFVALRYLRVKQGESVRAINFITFIASAGVMFTTAALFVILSAFSGLRSFNIGLINKTDPDLRILPASGKYLTYSDSILQRIAVITGSVPIPVLEEKVLARYGEKQTVVYMRGIAPTYIQIMHPDSVLIAGDWFDENLPEAVMGTELADKLSVSVGSLKNLLTLMAPAKTRISGTAFRSSDFIVSGIYQVTPDFERKYIFVPLPEARKMFGFPDRKISFFDIRLKPGVDIKKIKKRLQTAFPNWKIEDKMELNKIMFRMLNTENLVTYFVGTLILIIAVFNIIGTLIILIIGKKRDRFVFYAVGSTRQGIYRIFFYYGFLLILLSGLTGLLLGWLIVLSQKHYQWLTVPGTTLPYPVEITSGNFLVVLSTVFILAFTASALAARPARNVSND